MANRTIPFYGVERQNIALRCELVPAVQQTLESGILTCGPRTEEFEAKLGEFKSQRDQMVAMQPFGHRMAAVAFSSGSLALEAILFCVKQKYMQRDSMPLTLCPALTFRATANAIIRAGLTPKFQDVDAYGLMVREDAASHGLPALAVHVGLYGNSSSVAVHSRSIAAPVSLASIPTVIDGAQDWITASTVGIIAVTASFDATKNLQATGAGGAVFVPHRHTEVIESLKSWRNNSGKLRGTNAKMTEAEAAMLSVKLNYLAGWQQRRNSIAGYWINELNQASHAIRLLTDHSNRKFHSHQKFVIDLQQTIDREHFRQYLQDHGIPTMVHYEHPLHEYHDYDCYDNPGILSVASALSRKVVSLPMHAELTDTEVEHISNTIIRYTETHRTV